MTNSSTDQQSAVELLKLRADGYSLRRMLRKMMRDHLLYLAQLVAALDLGFSRHEPLWLLVAGLYAGLLARDCHWLRAGKEQWRFTSQVTDWAKVERMAAADIPAANEAADKAPVLTDQW